MPEFQKRDEDKPKYEKPVVIDLVEPLEGHGLCNSNTSSMLDGSGGFKVG